jgi:hypothetical protein
MDTMKDTKPDDTEKCFKAILRGALHTPPIPNEAIPALAAVAKARQESGVTRRIKEKRLP